MDFGLLPPEINSGLIYTGAGPGPLVEAGQAWNTLSTELSCAAQAYQSVITNLTTVWQGPSAQAMTAAVAPYLQWLQTASLQAAETAGQATVAAEAFSVAFAATVPPVEVAANRAQLLMLVATNLLGQNTPAIAANEAMYAQMWAQDAAAMNTYAASSSTATQGLPKFAPAPQTTSGSTPQAATAVPAQTTLLQFIQQLIPGFTPGDPLGNLADLLTSPLGIAFVGSGAYLDSAIALLVGLLGFSMITAATQESAHAIANAGHATGGNATANVTIPPQPPVKASTGSAPSLGRMRVPPSWAQPQPGKEPDRWPPQPINAHVTGPRAAIPAVPFMPVTGMRSNQAKMREEPEYGTVSKVLPPRHPAGG